MKKSLAIMTIITLHAAVISMLLVQSGCTEEPPAKASSQVTEIASAETPEEIKEPKEIVPPEGSPALRTNPTRPNWGSQDDQGKDAEALKPENTAKTSGEAIAPAPIAPAAQPKQAAQTQDSVYIVKKGDNLSKIAAKSGVSVAEICKANNITTKSILQIGQKLSIPGGASLPASATPASPQNVKSENLSKELEVYVVQRGDSLSRIAHQRGTTVASLMAINSLKNHNIRIGQKLHVEKISPEKAAQSKTANAPVAGEGEILHTVKSGEYLGSIAQKYSVSVKEICKLNSITDPRKLRAGQVLKIKTAKTKDAPEAKKPQESSKGAKTPENRTIEDPAKPVENLLSPMVESSAANSKGLNDSSLSSPKPENAKDAPAPKTGTAMPAEPVDDDNIPVVNL